MATPRFRLEQVLTYRCDIEKLRLQDFAQAKQALEHASDSLHRAKEHVGGVSEEFCSRQAELENIDDVRMYADFFARKREEFRQQQEQVDLLNSEMHQRRDDLLDATKDKKVLESLKQKHEQEFRELMARREQAFLDEISIFKKKESA